MASRLKKVIFAAILIIGPVAVALMGLYLVAYLPRVRELHETRKPKTTELDTYPNVEPAAIRHVGLLKPLSRSAFIHFPAAKPAGTLRLCAFGDSYTRGSEAGAEHDFPSFLQPILERRWGGGIEVLNFGGSAHGFHQTYIMWDLVGRKYDCDRVLLGPLGFQPKRDTHFNHSDLRSPYYLHARYILRDGEVELVEVLGETHEERFRHYFHFLPHFRYLRYDRNAPMLLQSLAPRGRKVRNPFYYHSDPEAEALETYRILLTRMLSSGRPIVLGHYWRQIYELGRQFEGEGLVAGKFHRPRSFPYTAPVAHNSAWGNRLAAEQFLGLLEGRRQIEATVVVTRDIPRPDVPETAPERFPISSYDSLELEMAGQAVGHLTVASTGQSRGQGSPAALRGKGAQSLLVIKSPRASVADGCFVPLDLDLEPGMELTLRTGSGDSGPANVLGRVELIDSRVQVGVVSTTVFQFHNQDRLSLRDEAREGLGPDARARIELGGRRILEERGRGRRPALRPVRGQLWRLRVPPRAFVDPEGLPEEGLLHLVLERSGEPTVRLAVARWMKTRRKIDLHPDLTSETRSRGEEPTTTGSAGG